MDHENSNELWIDSSMPWDIDVNHEIFKGVDQVFFYDFFGATHSLTPKRKNEILNVAQKYKTIWYTANPLPVDGIQCVRFDHMWNRTKWAYLEGNLGWKYGVDVRAYQQYPLHWAPRRYRYLSLNRSSHELREKLYDFLATWPGWRSHVSKGVILGNDFATPADIAIGTTMLPAQHFFDSSYVSCQVESQYYGKDSIYFSEKTYDHLIQGRLVLNFGPPGFYSALAADGWMLPVGIDLSWDSIDNLFPRFDAYLGVLNDLFSKPIEQLHELFLDNAHVIEHNYNMLKTKPYYSIK